MGKNIPKESKEGMYKAILELKSLEECFDFFEDTPLLFHYYSRQIDY